MKDTLPDEKRLSATLALVDRLLQSGCYAELEQLSGGMRLTAEEIESAIRSHPEPLGLRPAYELGDDEIVHVSGSTPAAWAVYLHLWRSDGKRSDLTVELTIADADSELYRVEIDDIHIL
jgi:hypothetical protein